MSFKWTTEHRNSSKQIKSPNHKGQSFNIMTHIAFSLILPPFLYVLHKVQNPATVSLSLCAPGFHQGYKLKNCDIAHKLVINQITALFKGSKTMGHKWGKTDGAEWYIQFACLAQPVWHSLHVSWSLCCMKLQVSKYYLL